MVSHLRFWESVQKLCELERQQNLGIFGSQRREYLVWDIILVALKTLRRV